MRLLQRQELQAAVVDLDLQVVDVLVAGDDAVAPSCRRGRSGRTIAWWTRSSTSAPIVEQPVLERLQLVFEMMSFHASGHLPVYPKRPVM